MFDPFHASKAIAKFGSLFVQRVGRHRLAGATADLSNLARVIDCLVAAASGARQQSDSPVDGDLAKTPRREKIFARSSLG